MRRWLMCVVMIFALWAPRVAVATVPADPSGDTTPAGQITTTTINNAFLDTERDISECIGNSNERPGCGREPTQAGDRGGWLQYATLLTMAAGLGFIFWRVSRAVRARDAVMNATPK